MLQAEGLYLRRGSNEVLHDIHLQLSQGQVVGVLGPNGAGKSSLLGVLCGELAPDHGRVMLSGRKPYMTRVPFRSPDKTAPWPA